MYSKSRREEINSKISLSLKGKNLKGKYLNCIVCDATYYRKMSKIKNSRFCSRICCIKYLNKHTNLASIAGRSSAIKQNKRSKNEKYFAELCQKHFNDVKTNEKMFNGWDADIIIEDLKIAIMWNGSWHYKKITKKHSLKQVQQRDKIKIKEIKKCNYDSYVIKDMGKHNKKFVEREFLKFLKYCSIK